MNSTSSSCEASEMAGHDDPATPCDMHAGDDMVIVEQRLKPAEAAILRATLVAGGVPAVVDDVNTAHYFGYLAYALDGVRIRVPARHAAQAREILAAIAADRYKLEEWEYNPDDPAFDEPQSEPDIGHERLLAFTQDASYARRWHQATPRTGFMWSALFFGSVWFLYRKLYRTGTLLFFIESMLLCGIASSGASQLSFAAFIALRILVACTAEGLYYARARTITHEVTQMLDDEARVRDMLKRRGGVSFPLGLGALFLQRLLTYAL
ncbi:DUF2628 domain-containing protein [Uliginosibacterium sp. H3]|uniref:DUF2628 domain-containing protein n=1 Tax=Uliginosibacterium silvisoli TaxID=3114758 RepID=A0ABU6K3F1_9RHOO|nr:DUF2628 domain-containing protein [Uliginosibacterium sp. H3]